MWKKTSGTKFAQNRTKNVLKVTKKSSQRQLHRIEQKVANIK